MSYQSNSADADAKTPLTPPLHNIPKHDLNTQKLRFCCRFPPKCLNNPPEHSLVDKNSKQRLKKYFKELKKNDIKCKTAHLPGAMVIRLVLISVSFLQAP